MATDLLMRQRMEVRAEGDRVKLSIGNAEMGMDYETALQLSQWLRIRGKEAKRTAGDLSRHWSAIGIIEGLR
jgi:hypothetical protein